MALMNLSASSLYPNPSSSPPPFMIPKHKYLYSSSFRTLAQPEKTETGTSQQEPSPSFSGMHIYTYMNFVSQIVYFLYQLKLMDE